MLLSGLLPVHFQEAKCTHRSCNVISRLSVLIAGLAFAVSGHAQLTFVSPTSLTDDIANQGSPILVNRSGGLVMYYVNHGNNTVSVDFGIAGRPTQTNIPVSSTILTDIGAAQLSNGQILLSFINTGNQVDFAVSSDGINFTAQGVPSTASLGLPSGDTVDTGLTPALITNKGTTYVATVDRTSGAIYISETGDGKTFTPLTPGTPVNGNVAVSRPSLTVYSGNVWMGFTTASGNSNPEAIVGNILVPSSFNAVSAWQWGQSNRSYNGKKYWAGISIMGYGSTLYLFGQSTQASQYLLYSWSTTPSTPSSWATQVNVTPAFKMRWTPAAFLFSNAYLAYQNDANTNISFTHN